MFYAGKNFWNSVHVTSRSASCLWDWSPVSEIYVYISLSLHLFFWPASIFFQTNLEQSFHFSPLAQLHVKLPCLVSSRFLCPLPSLNTNVPHSSNNSPCHLFYVISNTFGTFTKCFCCTLFKSPPPRRLVELIRTLPLLKEVTSFIILANLQPPVLLHSCSLSFKIVGNVF